ncbi:hypothetical protein K439DRAFT_1660305 [Ramaria rubella]|nr:hypothetical protein K439DRAFT_1660305 [Ramaria rubella]
MPKVTTQKVTKAATKTATAKLMKPAKEIKEKRAPSAYNVFMKDKLTDYKSNHPELSHKEAFSAASTFDYQSPSPSPSRRRSHNVAGLWKDAAENPNRGQEARSRKKTAEDKENVISKPKSKPKAKKVVEQSEQEDNLSSEN